MWHRSGDAVNGFFSHVVSFELNRAETLTVIQIRAGLKAHAVTAVLEASSHCDYITCV